MFASLAIANLENTLYNPAVRQLLILFTPSVQHSMKDKQYTLDIDESRLPYNANMVFPLMTLEVVMPLLLDEIMMGLVNTQGNDLVSLQLFLSEAKMRQLRSLLADAAFEEVHPQT
ncbi:MAG: hypothetical protein WKF70_02900 [Chitinophagaceae bacterium]